MKREIKKQCQHEVLLMPFLSSEGDLYGRQCPFCCEKWFSFQQKEIKRLHPKVVLLVWNYGNDRSKVIRMIREMKRNCMGFQEEFYFQLDASRQAIWETSLPVSKSVETPEVWKHKIKKKER